MDTDWQQHVGRAETRHDIADAHRQAGLAATLDLPADADTVPPLGHFLLFQPDAPQSRIGPDGHPLRGGDELIPDTGLPRRMWAGSRITFGRPIRVGEAVVRHSRLAAITAKTGRSGRMVFCTVAHRITAGDDADPCIVEEQDIVFREAHAGGGEAPRPAIAPEWTPDIARTLRADPTMLFRYSALTFNAHRIHYDREYATRVEGYGGLVVHGPLLATLMLGTLLAAHPDRRIAAFDFRAVSPVLDGEAFTLGARMDGAAAALSIVGPLGLAMQGSARFAG